MSASLVVYLPNLAGGGAERSHINLAPELIRKGYQVTFLVNRVEGDLKNHLPDGVRLVSLDRGKILRTILPLKRFLDREKPDILLCNLYECNILGIIAVRLSQSPTLVVASIHSALSTCCRYNKNWKIKLLPMIYRLLLPFAQGVIAVSLGVADDLAQRTGLRRDRITAIYNPVITNKMALALQRDPAPASVDTPYILGIGRLVPLKGFACLINAFAQIAPKRPHLKLVLLGQGPLRGDLAAQAQALGIADRVLLPGYLADPLPILRHAAVYVLSSHFEGLGNALIEALACGTPSVSTDCPYGPAEILENGQWGPLVPVGDSAALAASIEQTLDHPLSSEKLRQRGMMFTAQRAAGEYDALLQSLLRARA